MAHIRTYDGPRGRTYQVRYRDPSNRPQTKSFKLKRDAVAFASVVETSKLKGEYVAPSAGRVTFADHAAEVLKTLAMSKRPSTIASDESVMENVVLPHFGKRRLGQVTQAEVQAWVNRTAEHYSASTTRKAHQLLSNVFDGAVNADLIGRTPCRGITLPKLERQEQRFLTVDEINRLADTIEPRYRALVLTAAYTGCRFGELAALRFGRNGYDPARRRITVTRTLTEVRGHLHEGPPKTQAANRAISLPTFLVDEVTRHLEHYPGDAGYLFTAEEGGRLRRRNFRKRVWLPAVEAAGLDGLRFHDLRHTMVALLVAAGEHPKVIGSRLGHATIRTTLDTYGHLFEGLDEAAADRLDGLATR